MTPFLFVALLATPSPDTTLVDVIFAPTQQHVLVEALLVDTTVWLPAQPVFDLLGLARPPTLWITPAALQRQWPTILVSWQPRNQQVVILDNLAVLPASKRARESHLSEVRYAFSLPQQSGPFAALAWDDAGHSALLDLGYNWRGKISVAGRGDYHGHATWSASLAPAPFLYLSYADGREQLATGSARVALGPVWLSGSYLSPHTPVDLSGLFHAGPLQLFASSTIGVVTVTPVGGMVVQAARAWQTKQSAFRVSIGPAPLSPFTMPIVSLTGR